MYVNPRTSMEAAKRLVQRTHTRIQSRTERIEQAYRHQREQRDKATERAREREHNADTLPPVEDAE